ncbi:MAG: ThiF family adenylyltransferase [Acidobacteria bacterium]|nr:ThiF family adenylyltransferase [Acidobacteriota bacterium]
MVVTVAAETLVLQSVASLLEPDMGTAVLTGQDSQIKTDYSRLDGTPFQRDAVRSLRTVVAGAGALGNEVVKALGLLGVGEVLIVDPDRVEPSNLSRSVLFRTSQAVGTNKAETLAEACSAHFPDTIWRDAGHEFADLGFAHLRAADLIFGCVDNEMARLEMAYAAAKLDRPVCDGGLGSAEMSRGRVSWFPGRDGACYSCRLRSQTRRELLAAWEVPRYSCWGDTPSGDAGFLSSTPTMAAIVGSMQVEIGLKHLLEQRRTGASQSFSIDLSLSAPVRMESIELKRSASCPFHDEPGGLLMPASGDATFRDILGSIATPAPGTRPVVVLDWPICTSAACDDCGYRWEPFRRAAALRRYGLCPRCHSRYVRECETIRRIDLDSPWAGRTPSELGLPMSHLHSIAFEQEDAQ